MLQVSDVCPPRDGAFPYTVALISGDKVFSLLSHLLLARTISFSPCRDHDEKKKKDTYVSNGAASKRSKYVEGSLSFRTNAVRWRSMRGA